MFFEQGKQRWQENHYQDVWMYNFQKHYKNNHSQHCVNTEQLKRGGGGRKLQILCGQVTDKIQWERWRPASFLCLETPVE